MGTKSLLAVFAGIAVAFLTQPYSRAAAEQDLQRDAGLLANAATSRPEDALALLKPLASGLLECEARLTRAELFSATRNIAEALVELEGLPKSGCVLGLRIAATALGANLGRERGDRRLELDWLMRWLQLRVTAYQASVDSAAEGKTSLQIQKALNRDGRDLAAGWQRVSDLRALLGDAEGSRAALAELYLRYPQTEEGSKVEPRLAQRAAGDAELFARARILAAVGRLDSALAALEPLSMAAKDPIILERTLLELGDLNERRRNGAASAAALDRVLKSAAPSSVSAQRGRFLLSRTLFRRLQKRSGEVLPLLESLDTDTTDPRIRESALQFRVGVLQEVGRDAQAMKLLAAEGARKGSSIREWALEKLGWLRYSRNDWAGSVKAYAELLALPASGELRAAGLYWSGRAHDHMGQPAQARKLYGEAAAEFPFHWYGLASLNRWGRQHESELPEVAAPPLVAKWASSRVPPAIAPKVEALLQRNLNRFAAWQLEAALVDEPDNLRCLVLLSELRARQGDYEESVLLANRGFGSVRHAGLRRAPKELLRLLYPLPYSSDLKRFADLQRVPAPLAAGVIHQESGFFSHVVSSAGAVGLMQLMPETAARLARQLELANYDEKQLEDPAINLQLGMAFLGGLLRRFGEQLPPAVASYNAGPERAKQWWTARNAGDIALWVERIPYSETRDYVKKVLGKAEAYRRLYPELTAGER